MFSITTETNSLRKFLEFNNCGGDMHPKYRLPCFTGTYLRLNQREEVTEHRYPSLSAPWLWMLVWAALPRSCCYAFPFTVERSLDLWAQTSSGAPKLCLLGILLQQQHMWLVHLSSSLSAPHHPSPSPWGSTPMELVCLMHKPLCPLGLRMLNLRQITVIQCTLKAGCFLNTLLSLLLIPTTP